MSYKTDNPRKVEDQFKEDGVEDELHNLGAEVLCLVYSRKEYTRVYLAAPKKGVVSVTIDEPDTFKRTMEVNRVTNQYRVAGAKVKMSFG